MAGVLRGSGLYTAPGRAFLDTPPWRGPSLCVLEALRWVVGGETMTTPVGRAQPSEHTITFPVLGSPASS
jgi:hypothetical protein